MKRLKRSNLKNLTAREIYDRYIGVEVKLFISYMMVDNPSAKTMKDICLIYSKDIPGVEGTFFTTEELEHISNLAAQYLEEYLDKRGGLENFQLYSEEELEEIDKEAVDGVFQVIKENYGLSREEALRAFSEVFDE